MKLYNVFAIFALVLTFAIAIEGLFFGNVPRSSCSYDNQCQTRKCIEKGNPFCGFGSKYYLLYNLFRMNI